MTAKRLIVNADDFGMSRGISDAILIAHRHGFLTSASLVVNMPASEYALERLAKAPNLGVGIHLNICQGKPILHPHEIPSLVDTSGDFHSPPALIQRIWRWQISKQDVQAEFRAQIRWMKDRGIEPTHADSHHHMHIYPAAVRPFLRALATEGVHRTRAPRCRTFPRNSTIGGPHEGSVVRRIAVQSYRSALQIIAFRTIHCPDSRISFLSRDRKNLRTLREKWVAALEHLPAGTFELACHPGIPEPGFSHEDRISYQREEELRCLIDPKFREILARTGIELITYSELSNKRVVHQHAARAAMF
ncbi:MAG: ChbG/HpnK family deacetylase [Candidatus Acidiferrales bacterium]